MIYGITTLTLGNSGFIELEEKEFNKYLNTRNVILEALHIEEKYEFVIGNYLEFEEELLILGARHMVLPRETPSVAHDERRVISRRIANLLSMCKLYIDQSLHHISNIYGSESKTFKTIQEEQNKQYDRFLGYRFMEALRNHVQHRGYPIHSVKYSSNIVDEQVLFTFNPYILKKSLDDDEKFKQAILTELEDLGDEIDIKPHMREYIEGLATIQSGIREILIHDLRVWDNLFQEIETRFKEKYGSEVSLAGLALVIVGDNKKYIEQYVVTSEFIDRRKSLEKRNHNLDGLTRRYVSNEIR